MEKAFEVTANTAWTMLIITIANIYTFFRMFTIKHDDRKHWGILISLTSILVCIFMLAIMVFKVPLARAAMLFASIPSLILFIIFSKYKGARFFITFCYFDMLSIINSAATTGIAIYMGYDGTVAEPLLAFVICLTEVMILIRFSKKYRTIMEYEGVNWTSICIIGIINYIAVCFFINYPTVLGNRLQDMPYLIVLCIVISSTFILSLRLIFHTKSIYEKNIMLMKLREDKDNIFLESLTDGLTGIGNRKALRLAFDDLLSEGSEALYCLAMTDLDHFKHINDKYGHDVGDMYIIEYSRICAGIIKKYNAGSIFRYGGDEFTIIFKSDLEKSREICEEISSLLPKSEVFNKYTPITCSFGMTKWDGKYSPSELIKKADDALYKAKETRGSINIL